MVTASINAADWIVFAGCVIGVGGWCVLMLGILLVAEWDWTSRSEPSLHADDAGTESRVLLDDGSLQEAELP